MTIKLAEISVEQARKMFIGKKKRRSAKQRAAEDAIALDLLRKSHAEFFARFICGHGIAAMNAQHPPRWIGERPEGWR